MHASRILAVAAAAALVSPLQAAHEPVCAIVGAKLVPVSGPVIAKGTLVLRGGTIEAVGSGVEAPPDARVIDGAGLVVTPGLIDGYGGLGLPAPKKSAKDAPPAEPIAPHRNALDRVQVADALKARDSGVTSALTIPQDGVLPGRSVLLSLAGDDAEALALVQPFGLHLHMATLAGSKYPGSLMGTQALARQSLCDAIHYRDEWAAYRAAPAGRRRPAYDSALEAWQDVIAGRVPLVVGARRENDVRRALDLADEFRIRVVAAGAPQAARLAELVKARKLPLVVGVDFDPPKDGGVPDDDEQARQDVDEAERNPARLHERGVAFGFGSGFAADYLAGIRKAIERGLPREAALRAATLGAAEALGVADRLGSLEKGKLANVVAWQGEPLSAEARARLVFVDGQLYEPFRKADGEEKEPAGKPESDTKGNAAAVAPWTPPEPPPATPGVLAIVGGTLLTASPAGAIERGTLLIENGRIAAVGRDVRVPAGAAVIDAAGRYVTPGLIDTHSHAAIEENVNECTDAVTAETRIADVIDAWDPSLLRQLAGGVTAINMLHGSCNAIGGQNAVIKLRYGHAAEALLFEGAPRGIKFALGENPKRANWGQPSDRYPRTRMGVEQVIRNAFAEAVAYKAEWAAYEKKRAAGGKAVPPRRDLRKETLRDVLDGKVFVHAHAYRADEMLMLMTVAEDFGFRVRTFQHGLEAYKVASEIAAHGAGVGTFIDWWGFKMEAWDAIPQNPAVLAEHGVKVSLNSDSDELARRLYWDAAKAVKYGGVSEEEALRMITIHAAWQLGVDERTGSLEAGKDADVVIFGAHPFSPEARVDMTLVDGRVYFDRTKAAVAAGGGQ